MLCVGHLDVFLTDNEVNMADNEKRKKSLFEDFLKIRVKGKPSKETEIGIASKSNSLVNVLGNLSDTSQLIDLSEFQKFRTLGTDRNSQYRMYDEMALDTIISTALELYTDDATQYNTNGQVIWAESEDANVSVFANRLIDVLQINENAWSHIYNLVKYGDLYLQLYEDGEIEDDPLVKPIEHSDVDLVSNKKGSHFVEYMDTVPNPADIFDLSARGKTVGFVGVHNLDNSDQDNVFRSYMYNKDDNNIQIYKPNKFVHIMLGNNSDRFPETFSLNYDVPVKGSKTNETTMKTANYKVKRGKSILYDTYKTYRELQLMEDALLLNRVTRSSIIRILQIEIGDMPPNQAEQVMRKYKRLIEQKNFMDKDKGTFTSSASPAPIDNVLYVPTRDGKGAVSMSNLGGDVDVKSITDIDHFKKKLYGGLKIPPMFLGDTDDSAGFSGGTSLTKLDSRYARTIKRIQNAYISGITTLINLFALDRGLDKYINNFTIKMTSPATTEDAERDETLGTRADVVDRLLGIIPEDMIDPKTRKEIIVYLMSNYLSQPDVSGMVEQDETLNEASEEEMDDMDMESHGEGGGFGGGSHTDIDMNFGGGNEEPDFGGGEDVGEPEMGGGEDLGGEDLGDIEI